MQHLVLYSTLGCHLCEQAKALSLPVLSGMGIELQEVDIANDDALIAAYGVLIPVLRDPQQGVELHWPFDAKKLAEWLARHG